MDEDDRGTYTLEEAIEGSQLGDLLIDFAEEKGIKPQELAEHVAVFLAYLVHAHAQEGKAFEVAGDLYEFIKRVIKSMQEMDIQELGDLSSGFSKEVH